MQTKLMRVVIGGADRLNMKVPHLHRHYELYYLLEGERHFFIRDRAFPMRPGSLAFTDGEQLHRVFSSKNVSHRRMVIFLEKDAVTGEALLEMFRIGGCIALTKSERADFEQMIRRLEREGEGTRPMREEMADTLVQYLLLAAFRAYRKPRAQLSYGGSVISDAVEYIGAHYTEPLTLPDLCGRLHVSVSHFTERFKSSTGFTFVEYLHHLRIQKAAELLEETRLPVSEIAQMVGFSGFSYFSKKFREIRGLSPLAYRAATRHASSH